MAEEKRRCKSFSRRTGEPCKNWAVPGSDYCKFHGGGALGNKGGRGRKKGMPKVEGSGSGPSEGNQNAKKHGAYSTRLQPGERVRYESIRARYEEGFENLTEIDQDCLHRLAMFQVKLESALENGAPGEALEPLQRMIHRELKALQATREAKDMTTFTGNSPAEVVAALLMKVRAVEEPKHVNVLTHDSDVIDVEAKPVEEDGK